MVSQVCDYGRFVTIGMPYTSALAAVKAALKDEGFGVLCEIDVAKTLKDKIGETVAPHVILGACNPVLAHAALKVEPNLGLLLPCNVVVREADDTTIVGAIDPQAMLQVAHNPALNSIASDASARLDRVLTRLAQR